VVEEEKEEGENEEEVGRMRGRLFLCVQSATQCVRDSVRRRIRTLQFVPPVPPLILLK